MRPPERPRVIAHVDMDAFYVSVELQRRPELRGLPVVVAGSGPRAVVTTASYEARAYGVFSATPASRARRLCPQAVFVQPEFDHYRDRSRAVMEVVREQIETVEVVGLDEAYLDLTPLGQPKAAARRVKAAVREATGLVCSIGIGPNKLVAKVASDAGKPDGFLALTSAEARERFKGHSPGLIPGIGPKSVERLRQRGIETLGVLAEAPDATLAEWFGSRLGPHLGCLARLEDERPIETARIRKSESRETTFDRDLRGLGELEPVLECLTAQLSADLERHGRRGRTVGIKVRLDDFSTLTRARTLTRAVNDTPTVLGVARGLLVALNPQRPVRLLGVRVAGLDAEPPVGPAAGVDPQLELTL
ncbi:MAG TPA: DNA polymerase IV [Thermoleophilaceae bacterium]|nr:DNA polymerase IV [Thermoleophilaceae bacterium]